MEGWGECVVGEDPGYSPETTETAWHVLTDFVLPAIVGREAAGEDREDRDEHGPWSRRAGAEDSGPFRTAGRASGEEAAPGASAGRTRSNPSPWPISSS